MADQDFHFVTLSEVYPDLYRAEQLVQRAAQSHCNRVAQLLIEYGAHLKTATDPSQREAAFGALRILRSYMEDVASGMLQLCNQAQHLEMVSSAQDGDERLKDLLSALNE